ncbi:GINS complex subunit 3 [Dorcoceras hygrometricum]|uniref:GINS complex subunit 3 n=1 Tax=Dorcoceras hygrometricum TaxID=472368 RepID=A0A2Z7A6Q6_9LAMI|nr:GINS complex subunit 3 [Dorcoceras hygrometricum]
MSLFDLQDVCIAIGSIATLDLPMVVDLIGIYGLKGPYCTLTTTNCDLVIYRTTLVRTFQVWLTDPSREMRVTRVTRSASKTGILVHADQYNKARLTRSELNMIHEWMQMQQITTSNTKHTLDHGTASITHIHAKSNAVKQAHIRTSVLSYNYNNEVPSNADFENLLSNNAQNLRDSSTEATTGSYELNQRYPTLLTQHKALNEAQEGRCLRESFQASRKLPKSSTKRSVLERGVQCYHSYFSRSCLPPAIGEDKVRWVARVS